MKSFVAILLSIMSLSASAATRSATVTTLEEDVSKRQSLLVSLSPEAEGETPKEIRIQPKGYFPGGSATLVYNITSISTDACGNTTYEATFRGHRPLIPEQHNLVKLIDYSDRICFIHRPFSWEFTMIFRDDLKETAIETKFFGLPANESSAATRSSTITTLEKDVSQRKAAFVWLYPRTEGTNAEEIRVMHFEPSDYRPYVAYTITSVATGRCGETIYKAILEEKEPRHSYEAELVDYPDVTTCFINKPFQREFTTIFRDDLKGTSQEVKYYDVPRNKLLDPSSTALERNSGGTVEVKFKTDKGASTAAYLANYTATFQCRGLGGSLGDRILFEYDQKTGDTRAVYVCLGGSTITDEHSPTVDSRPLPINVNGDDLTCRPYIGGSKSIVLRADYLKALGLKHTPSFSTLVDEEGCSVIEPLKGKMHRVFVNVEKDRYKATQCEISASVECSKPACFEFLSEYATLFFSNGLTLRSRTPSPIQTLLYSGECKK
jgi:hypothetical protein